MKSLGGVVIKEVKVFLSLAIWEMAGTEKRSSSGRNILYRVFFEFSFILLSSIRKMRTLELSTGFYQTYLINDFILQNKKYLFIP